MINLPNFDAQSMYDYETNYNLTTNVERLSKFIIHYEAIKIVQNIPGAIVECGVFKGTSFSRFALFRELYGTKYSKKLVAFDDFSDSYPDTQYDEDKLIRENWINNAGESSISVDQLTKVFENNNIDNYDLIKGDVVDTVPKFARNNKGFKISLLNIDIDFVEPTYCVLENLYPMVKN